MAVLQWVPLILVGYLIGLAVYRLYLGPLARFPGPRLAALTGFYEAFYEICLKGQFTFHLDKLHEQYGPIVRITPDAVHIKDSSFWSEVFVRRPKADKEPSIMRRFGYVVSMFSVGDAAWHKRLRAPLAPFFSKRSILEQESLVQEKAERLCDGFKRCASSGTVVPATHAFAAYGADVISQYAFGFSYGQVEKDGWPENYHDAYIALNEFGHVIVQFPWLAKVLDTIPESIVEKMNPDFAKMLQLKRDLRQTVKMIKDDPGEKRSDKASRTMFHAFLESNLPESDKTNIRMADEAQTVVGAGVTTTAWALTNALFYILADDKVLSNLQAELDQAIPDISAADAFGYNKLEKLSYLNGCVKEGIRRSYGVSGRLGRVFHEPLIYKDWTIPTGTSVVMSMRHISLDEDIFENAREYKPSRWMPGAPRAGDGSSLDEYFVPFGSGPRMCLGINLAYMELFVVLAQIFRRFSMELYETDITDVELAHDFFIPSPKLGSKGVRVKVVDVRK